MSKGVEKLKDRKLNIGIVGAGYIGQIAHLMNYVEVKDCRIVALAELRPILRRKVAERYNIPRTYETHRELLQDPEVEAVVIVTPRPHTGPVALECLNAGKHVITEKPMASTFEQGKRLVDAAQKRKLHYVVGHMKRYDEGVQLGKRILNELMASQELGPILFARAHCFMGDSFCNADGHIVTDEKVNYPNDGWPVAPDWLPQECARDYAAFLNTFSHTTNLIRYLLNSTPSVEYVSYGQPAGRIAILRFNGFVASLETGSSSNRGWDEITEIYFADGRLTIRNQPALLRNVPAQVELYKAGQVQEICSPQCNWSWAFRRQAEAFVKDVLENRASISSGVDALEDLRLIEELWRKEIDRRQIKPRQFAEQDLAPRLKV